MKTLKKVTALAFLFAAMLAGTSAYAQQAQGDGQGRARLTTEERVKMQLDRYQKQLELTPEQSTKLQAIILTAAQDMEKMRAAGTRPDREAMQAASQKRNEEIKALLTPAQQEKFATMLANQMERGQGGQGGGARRVNSQGNR